MGEGEQLPIEYEEFASEDKGEHGTKYQIRLRVRGKWRTVDWEKLEEIDESATDTSDYQIVGSWNDGMPEDMGRDPDNLDTYFLEVLFPTDGGFFQIIRNRDWEQTFYPADPHGHAYAEILGPDEQVGNAWVVEANKGDVFRIEFSRVKSEGSDVKKVSWNFVRKEAVPEGMVARLARRQYFI